MSDDEVDSGSGYTENICMNFVKFRECKLNEQCTYKHIDCPNFQSWLISGIPLDVTGVDIYKAFYKVFLLPNNKFGKCMVELKVLKGNVNNPHCFVTFFPLDKNEKEVDDTSLINDGFLVNGIQCSVKKRKNSKRQTREKLEKEQKAKNDRIKRRKIDREGDWTWDLLKKFPQRKTTLDQNVQVADLSKELISVITEKYLPSRLPQEHRIVTAALRHVWEKHPKSLRFKELLETVETFVSISKQIGFLNQKIEVIYDFACGHGLLGILYALRFPDKRILCIDLEYRECFEHYLAGFKAVLKSKDAMNNVEFVVDDIANTVVKAGKSFITCIHACNEANKIAVSLALDSNNGFAAMPCCVRNGLYSVNRVNHLDDDDGRYQVMVGVMAGMVKAHTISAINRGITNRNLIIYGGYPMHV